MRIALDAVGTSGHLRVTRTTPVESAVIEGGQEVQLLMMPRGQGALRLWYGRVDHLTLFAGLPDAEHWADVAGLEERADTWT